MTFYLTHTVCKTFSEHMDSLAPTMSASEGSFCH